MTLTGLRLVGNMFHNNAGCMVELGDFAGTYAGFIIEHNGLPTSEVAGTSDIGNQDVTKAILKFQISPNTTMRFSNLSAVGNPAGSGPVLLFEAVPGA